MLYTRLCHTLITAVFVSHIKILASINNKEKQINLVIPKTINFIHKCYINIARELWNNPYLFDENIKGWEYQRNIKTIESLIIECIELTIRKLLPIKDIFYILLQYIVIQSYYWNSILLL